jgi:hypothetical protein
MQGFPFTSFGEDDTDAVRYWKARDSKRGLKGFNSSRRDQLGERRMNEKRMREHLMIG